MKTLKPLLIGMLIMALATGPAYAAPGGNGNGNGPKKDKIKKVKVHGPKQTNEKRARAIERGRKQADVRANLPEKANHSAMIERGRSADHRNIKDDKTHPHDLFASLEKARWSHNPNDEKGQGNMGKPNMRDPYGHDKDSGREGDERGRPIQETGWTMNIEFTDYWLIYWQNRATLYQSLLDEGSKPWMAIHYSGWIAHAERMINYYLTFPTYKTMTANGAITYTLTLDGVEGTNLLVTTSLININDYRGYTMVYDPATGKYFMNYESSLQYDAGQVLMEQTQEVTLGSDNTLSYSYDPPTNLAGYNGFYADLVVTVTEPESGVSYTTTSDKQYYVYRCPYGKVTDKKTGESIVGAKVTVHYEDGSIVTLDKASNSTASNPQITDATGRYGFKLRINRKYYLTATADGYEDYKSEVFTEKWHVLREDVALAPSEEEKNELIASRIE